MTSLSPWTVLQMHADDTELTVAGDSVEEIGIKMTENCQLVSNWMIGNKLKLNAGKIIVRNMMNTISRLTKWLRFLIVLI